MSPVHAPAPASPAPGPVVPHDPFAGATLPAAEPYVMLAALFLLVVYLMRKGVEISFKGR